MNRKLLAVMVMVMMMAMGSGYSIAWCDEFTYVKVNPIYDGIPSRQVLSAFDQLQSAVAVPTECFSFEAFKAALKKEYLSRTTQFSILLKYDFLFSDLGLILNQAHDEIVTEDGYLGLNFKTAQWSASGNNGNCRVDYSVAYLTTSSQEQQISEKVTAVLNEIIREEMSDEEVERAIHDWIVLHVAYDEELTRYSAHSALFEGKSLCQGYALLTYRMLQQIGIENRIVVGKGNGIGHAWNLVYICGSWYHLDATFDDPIPDVPGRILGSYFNRSDKEMKADHVWETEKYPSAPLSYGTGVCAGFSADKVLSGEPISADFGVFYVNTRSDSQLFSFTNGGNKAVDVGDVILVGNDNRSFTIANDTCSGQPLNPSKACTVDVDFRPTTEGAKTAMLQMRSQTPVPRVLNLAVKGVGISEEVPKGWVRVGGKVFFGDIPLCALVLANGQHLFTCDGNGEYAMTVPLDSKGEITLFAFCDGREPFKKILTPWEATHYDIYMTSPSSESKTMIITAKVEPATVNPGWVRIRGVVLNNDGVELCALVLANGRHLFTCGDSQGNYDMEVPLDVNKAVTLFGFCDGTLPFKRIIQSE